MGDRYAVIGTENLATGTPVAILQITGDAGNRARIYDFLISAEGTMGDEVATYDVSRFTVAPTDTLRTPRALDPASPSAVHSDCGENGGTTGTITADSEMFEQGIHLRAAFRWVAVPGGELVMNLTAAHGILWRAAAPSSSSLVRVTAHFEE